jgi:anti-sigma regulatory factor (Ser/Thr protein kinase)
MNDRLIEAYVMRTFPADVNCLDAAFGFVRGTMEEAGVSDDAATGIELAVEEIFVNIALYAYRTGESGRYVTLRCEAGPEMFSLEFADSGEPFNPLEIGEPDLSLDVMKREPGGLGLFIVKRIMDVVEYRREEGKNVLCMRKCVP